jgi:hypothetical protein
MDGFDVARFQFGRSYHVPPKLGNYLVLAGYAEALTDIDRADDRPRRRARAKARR